MSDDAPVGAAKASETHVLHTFEDGAVLLSNGQVAVNVDLPDEITVEYGVFNDEDAWQPMFDAGEIHVSLREVLLERPLYATESLQEAAQRARLVNDERGRTGEADKTGQVVVKTRTVTRTAWSRVPLDDVARELGEF